MGSALFVYVRRLCHDHGRRLRQCVLPSDESRDSVADANRTTRCAQSQLCVDGVCARRAARNAHYCHTSGLYPILCVYVCGPRYIPEPSFRLVAGNNLPYRSSAILALLFIYFFPVSYTFFSPSLVLS